MRKYKFPQVASILFNFAQLLPGMRRDNRIYLLRIRIRIFGRNETVVLRHAEGSSCSWTTSTFWLCHWNPELRRRSKYWYRSVSQGNAGTVWKAIGILCKFLSFLLLADKKNHSSDFLWHCLLSHSFGIRWWVDWSAHWKESTICKWQLLCVQYFLIRAYFYKIFAHASPSATISEQLIEKIKSSGLGKLTTWSPQQFILNHPVLYPYYLSWLNTYN